MDFPLLTRSLLLVPTAIVALSFAVSAVLASHEQTRVAIVPIFWAYAAWLFFGSAGLLSASSILRQNVGSRTARNWLWILVGALPLAALVFAFISAAVTGRA